MRLRQLIPIEVKDGVAVDKFIVATDSTVANGELMTPEMAVGVWLVVVVLIYPMLRGLEAVPTTEETGAVVTEAMMKC